MYLKESGEMLEVRQGFPSYDDPLSPSGPTQVLAKVKSVPGVLWEFDTSALRVARESSKSWIRGGR